MCMASFILSLIVCNFRPGQLDAILLIMHGNDVFVRMATGSGKSLCMFLPPLVHSTKAAGSLLAPSGING